MFDPTVTFDDLAWITDQWRGKVVVEGVQSLDDARRLASMGVDGIILSDHGGRQLDRAPIPFHLLPDVAREVGTDLEVHLGTGIMSGADIVAAIALGADFTLVGRAYLCGLMAGGREGVDRMIEILSEQITRPMRLLGVTSLAELTPAHVTQLERLAPRALSLPAATVPRPDLPHGLVTFLVGESPRGELHFVVSMDDSAAGRSPIFDCHVQSLDDKGGVLTHCRSTSRRSFGRTCP